MSKYSLFQSYRAVCRGCLAFFCLLLSPLTLLAQEHALRFFQLTQHSTFESQLGEPRPVVLFEILNDSTNRYRANRYSGLIFRDGTQVVVVQMILAQNVSGESLTAQDTTFFAYLEAEQRGQGLLIPLQPVLTHHMETQDLGDELRRLRFHIDTLRERSLSLTQEFSQAHRTYYQSLRGEELNAIAKQIALTITEERDLSERISMQERYLEQLRSIDSPVDATRLSQLQSVAEQVRARLLRGD